MEALKGCDLCSKLLDDKTTLLYTRPQIKNLVLWCSSGEVSRSYWKGSTTFAVKAFVVLGIKKLR